MPRLLRVPLLDAAPGERTLPEEARVYLVRVHRARAGTPFVAFDPRRGVECDAELLDPGPPARVRLGELRAGRRPARTVTLLQALGKGDKPETVLRAATALGATRVVWLLTERVVARAQGQRDRRWAEVALDEARQCGRGDVPELDGPRPLVDALTALGPPRPEELRILLDPEGQAPLAALLGGGGPVVLLVGPEGGFATAERDAAVRAGFVPGRLGPFVLRTELAAAAALAVVAAVDAAVGPSPTPDAPPVQGGSMVRSTPG